MLTLMYNAVSSFQKITTKVIWTFQNIENEEDEKKPVKVT